MERALKKSSILPPVVQDEKLGYKEIESRGWVSAMQAGAPPSLPLPTLTHPQTLGEGANAHFHMSFSSFSQITTRKGKGKKKIP